jgi:plastocyanin
VNQTPQEKLPPMRPRRTRCRGVLALSALLTVTSALAGNLTVTTRQRNSQPLTGAVVMLESDAANAATAAPIAAIMDQVDLTFVPDVLVIPVHSTVQFPNSDAISHQVYSFSGARSFQLPLYRGRPYPPVLFDQPGVVTLGCNIHDNMVAYIVVTRAAHFGRTDAEGQWTANRVSPGRYRLRVWHPLMNEGREVTSDVTVENANSTAEIQLSRALRPAPLTGRPHSWDY